MLLQTPDPISTDWTTTTHQPRLAARACELLAHVHPGAIDAQLLPLLAAAATEAALDAGIEWRLSGDDPPVALLRLLARAALTNPDAGGQSVRTLIGALTT